MAAIYTRTGDSGESSVKNGRFRKDALVFDVLGDLDELNSWLGAIKVDFPAAEDGERGLLESIQRAIMALSADVVGYGPFRTDLIPRLEAEIDRISPADAFELRLPSGNVHVARAVCRRAERHLTAFNPAHAGLPFVNRLSDYLFALAESRQDHVSRGCKDVTK